MDILWQDTRYAIRGLRRSPGFATVAILSLALGIGANTAIFSLIHTVMLRTLPVQRPVELVELLQKYPGEPRGNGYWTWASFEYFRDHNHVFSALTGTSIDTRLQLRPEGGEAEVVTGEYVAGNFFPMLGLQAALGRLLGPDDDPTNGGGAVAVVSWSYWNARFHKSPSILGKRIFVQDAPVTIVGVAPRAYSGLLVELRTDIWLPRPSTPPRGLALLARLRPGVTLEQARAEMPVLYRFTIEERARNSKDPLVRQLRVEVESASTGLSRARDRLAKPLIAIMAVVAILLLIACINIAGILLARATGRQREMAVRVGLGASRFRLVRQALTESMILSAAGALLGVLMAQLGTGVLVRMIASAREHERIQLPVQVDLQALLFTATIALLTGLFFGLAPAWYAARSAPAAALKQTGRNGESRFGRLFGKGLVTAQVASSLLLLSAAASFLGYLSHLRNADLGFRRDHVLLVSLNPAGSGYERVRLSMAYQQLLAKLEAIPGVRSATISGATPIQGAGASRFVSAEGFVERPEDRRYVSLNWLAPKYFETFGTPLIAGRDFAFADYGRSRVAIVNQAMARYYFSGMSPIGKHVTLDGDALPYEIIGVAGDAKYTELRQPAPRTMYLNMFQEGRIQSQFALRTSVDPEAVAADVRRTVCDALKTVNVAKVTTLNEQVDASIVPERLIATLSGLFGVLGSLLAALGLYGLLAYTVVRRTHEIGIRMALGATKQRMSRMVIGEALAMSCAGLLVGIPFAWWSRQFAASLIPDLPVSSPTPIVIGVVVMIALAGVAAYLPARRAARVDPMEALRYE